MTELKSNHLHVVETKKVVNVGVVILPPKVERIRQIIRQEAAKMFMLPGRFLADDNRRPIAHARQFAMFRCRVEVGASFPMIAKEFYRDNQTVQFGVRQALRRIKSGELEYDDVRFRPVRSPRSRAHVRSPEEGADPAHLRPRKAAGQA